MTNEEIKSEAIHTAAEFIREQNQKLGLLKIIAAILAVSLIVTFAFSAIVIREQQEIITELCEVLGDGRDSGNPIFEMSGS